MRELARGMWVRVQEQTGVLFELQDDLAVVHTVDADGLTIGDVQTTVDQVTQAAWLDIPESRRPDQEKAAELGYF